MLTSSALALAYKVRRRAGGPGFLSTDGCFEAASAEGPCLGWTIFLHRAGVVPFYPQDKKRKPRTPEEIAERKACFDYFGSTHTEVGIVSCGRPSKRLKAIQPSRQKHC